MTRRYLILGQVQGVGFRYFVFRQANRLGLTGWVRNLSDGRVEVEAQGDADRMQALEDALRSGPSHATVGGVDITEISDEQTLHKSFEIK